MGIQEYGIVARRDGYSHVKSGMCGVGERHC